MSTTTTVPTTWSDRFGNVIDVSHPTTENIGLLPIGYNIARVGAIIIGVSDTAYEVEQADPETGRDVFWVSFDQVHGRRDAVQPLVTLDGAR